MRAYFWPYTEQFVPEGTVTSSFQSSALPSVRERIVREYAYGPLFGSRTPLCVLGFLVSPRDIVGRKPAIRAALADLLSCEVAAIQLGPLRATKDMMLYRGETPESPRLADGIASGSPRSAATRRQRYAREAIAATVLLEVFVTEDVAPTAAERLELGRFVQDRLMGHDGETAAFDEEVQQQHHHGSSPTASGEENSVAEDREVRARVIDAMEELKGDCGVVYCELGAEDCDYNLDMMFAGETENETAADVMARWAHRLSKQQPSTGGHAPPSAMAAASVPHVEEPAIH